jgi:SPP1 gp7 family putative phage head morphogenesis protein
MKQMNNFQKVIERINRRIGQIVRKGEREVARKFARVLVEIRKMLADLYEKYEVDGRLTYEDMLKFDRLNKFMKQINYLLQTHYKELAKLIEKILGETYTEGYYLTAWAVETETMTRLGYVAVRPETLTAMLNNPVAGLTLKQRLERNRAAIIYTIQQEITQGLMKNETYSTMAKRLKTALEGDAVKAMRIVRTEGHRVQESAKHDAAEYAHKQGVIMMKTWNSLEDERVRSSHRHLNNKTIPVDQHFKGKTGKGPAPGQLGSPSEDINCRCFLTYSIEKIEKKQYTEMEDITFERWKKERLKK